MAKIIKPIKLKKVLSGEISGTRKEVILSEDCIKKLKARAKINGMLLKPYMEKLLIQAANTSLKTFMESSATINES